MRILHTSDWHLGARLCDRDRSDEHRAFLDWLLLILKKEKIDVLLVSGDIFDSSNPPNSAEAIYYDFLCSIKETGCSAVVITGGNHDSVSKLNSPQALLKRLSITVIGGGEKEPARCIVPLDDKNGNLSAVICAVPFLRERDIRVPTPGESWEDREKSVAKGIKDYYDLALLEAQNVVRDKPVPLIAMGHLFVTGSLSGEGQRDLYVGNLGSITSDIFPDSFSYVALGHIHRSQKIGGDQKIRYCGSPLHMEFGEKGDKEILIADFDGEQLRNVRSIKIPLFRSLIRFKGSFEEVSSQIESFDVPDTPFWADAEIEGVSNAGDISLLLNERASEKGVELLRIKVLQSRSEIVFDQRETPEIKDLTAEEVFIERCLSGGLDDDEVDELIPLHRELMVKIAEQGDSLNED